MLSVTNLNHHIGSLSISSWEGKKGQLVALVGENGAGKTTFLKCLTGLLTPTAGDICFNGESLLPLSPKERAAIISYVPQQPSPTFGYTVEQMVEMGSYYKPVSSKAIDLALKRVRLTQLAQRPITSLSGGEQQRAYIARALLSDNPVLLLDEATASSDYCHQGLIGNLLKEEAAKGKVVIAIVHDLLWARHYCDQAIIMENGKIIHSGSAHTLLDKKKLGSLFHAEWLEEKELLTLT